MDKLVSYFAGILAIAAVFIAVSTTSIPGPVGPQGPQGSQGVAGIDGRNGSDGLSLGASSAPNLQNGCLDLGGGAVICQYQQAFKPNSSTTCAIKPGFASSTLLRATARVINPQGGTFDLEIGKSSTVMATTTSLGRNASVSAGTTLTASTSPQAGYSAANAPFNFASGDILNVKIGSSTHNVTGVCSATFTSI